MIRAQVTLPQLQKILARLPGHSEQATKDMLDYWMQKIIVRHFQFGNDTAYGYAPLDPKYLERKRKMFGRQPMLVASGELKDAVTSRYKIYKIAGKFRIILNIPEYGRYVRSIRDFTIINQRDRKDMLRQWKVAMIKRRTRFVRSMGR